MSFWVKSLTELTPLLFFFSMFSVIFFRAFPDVPAGVCSCVFSHLLCHYLWKVSLFSCRAEEIIGHPAADHTRHSALSKGVVHVHLSWSCQNQLSCVAVCCLCYSSLPFIFYNFSVVVVVQHDRWASKRSFRNFFLLVVISCTENESSGCFLWMFLLLFFYTL